MKVIALGVFSFLCIHLFGQTNPYIIQKSVRSLNIAHSGGQNLAPTNNMLAYDKSDSIGVDMMETDILLTKDGVLVLHHNETVDSKTNNKGFVKDYMLEELRKFNYGYNFKDTLGHYPYRDKPVQITTLEELLAKYGQKYSMCIELKNKDEVLGKQASEELFRLLVKYEMTNKTIVSCFDDKTLNYFRKISKGKAPTATAKKTTRNFVISKKLRMPFLSHPKDVALQIPVKQGNIRFDTDDFIQKAHKKNLAVHYWTINNAEEMKRLIRLGADGIMTDRPDILERVLEELYGTPKTPEDVK